MATYYVWSGATGTNAGTSWTNAYTAFGSAVTAATASGDVIKVHYTHTEELAAATTYTFSNNVNVISVDKNNSDAPTAMGASSWIGNSTTARNVSFAGAYKLFFYGITIRTGGTSAGSAGAILFTNNDGQNVIFDSSYFWLGATGGTQTFSIGTSGNLYVHFVNCTFRFAAVGQTIQLGTARLIFEKCNISSSGSVPTLLFGNTITDGAGEVFVIGSDVSFVTTTLVGSFSIAAKTVILAQCKLGANVTVLATQTPANKSSAAVYVFDCSSGDTHGLFGYYDAFGSCVSDTGIYYSTGAAAQSWKVVTTADCSYYTPFVSPFVDFYNTGTSSITPRFEILRDGSTTAFQDDEVWGEFFVKSTSGSTQSTPSSDRMALLGTAADQAAGAGTGSWTGEAGSAWSGKIDSGSAVTPAESGHIRGRVVVGEPSITVYVDPQIRT